MHDIQGRVGIPRCAECHAPLSSDDDQRMKLCAECVDFYR